MSGYAPNCFLSDAIGEELEYRLERDFDTRVG